MIFDIKMDGKARFVAGVHMTDPPLSVTYSCVVSKDIIRLGFLLALINNIGICDVDIGNAYLNYKCRDNVWCESGT